MSWLKLSSCMTAWNLLLRKKCLKKIQKKYLATDTKIKTHSWHIHRYNCQSLNCTENFKKNKITNPAANVWILRFYNSAITQRIKNYFFREMICVRRTKAQCLGNFLFHSHSVGNIDCGQGLGTVDWHNSQCALNIPQRRQQRKHHLKIISCSLKVIICMVNVF